MKASETPFPSIPSSRFSDANVIIEKKPFCRKRKRTGYWQLLDPQTISGPKYIPKIITQYTEQKTNRLSVEVKQHLLHLGWKIEFIKDKPNVRFRYTSPDGKCYLSLIKVCEDLRGETENPPPLPPPEPEIDVDDNAGDFNDNGCGMSESSCVPSRVLLFKGKHCPQAVVDWYKLGVEKNYRSRFNKKDVKEKAKEHLSALRWVFYYVERKGKFELRYKSPNGKNYYSLRTACKGCIDEGGASDIVGSKIFSNCIDIVSNCNNIEETEDQESSTPLNFVYSRKPRNNDDASINAEHFIETQMETQSVEAEEGLEHGLIVKNNDLSIIAEHPIEAQMATPAVEAEEGLEHGVIVKHGDLSINAENPIETQAVEAEQGLTHDPMKQSPQKQRVKRGKVIADMKKLRDGAKCSMSLPCVQLSSKRVQKEAVSNSAYRNPRTILSWLIENNVVSSGDKVHYGGLNGRAPLAWGRITSNGIKCDCCLNLFTLSRFEAHAGSTKHRPAANIFVEDGRSLLDCQRKLMQNNKMTAFTRRSDNNLRRYDWNDHICSVCHYGGELILCDRCPSSFHSRCLGLEDVPDGDWFCPSCCCGICYKSKIVQKQEESDSEFLNCDQCEHKYHIGCLKSKGTVDSGKLKLPKERWFCSRMCESIHLGLQKLLGKQIHVGGGDNLTWTLLKYINSPDDNQYSVENQSKLNIALSVMHECFEPVKESFTKRDVVEDVIFSRESELKRLNFKGFYTVVLERDDNLITVAIVRVFGGKVAEVPLVGTRFQYRKKGMCHVLMNELEKQLMELGVERLVLPAVPAVLKTWTGSFGFEIMSDYDRSQFLNYTFLDFQDTIMCQKLLRSETRRSQMDLHDKENHDGSTSSGVSEIYQADQFNVLEFAQALDFIAETL